MARAQHGRLGLGVLSLALTLALAGCGEGVADTSGGIDGTSLAAFEGAGASTEEIADARTATTEDGSASLATFRAAAGVDQTAWTYENTGVGLGDEGGSAGGAWADGSSTARQASWYTETAGGAGDGAGDGAVVGEASHYGRGDGLEGRPMANGQPMRSAALTAAHRTLPLNTYARVERLDAAGQVTSSVVVKVTDRGPAAWTGRVIDLSYGAANRLGFARAGTSQVRVTPLGAEGYAD